MTVKSSTGGWLVELGMCLGSGATLWVIGDRRTESNCFARLAHRWFTTYEAAEHALIRAHHDSRASGDRYQRIGRLVEARECSGPS